MTIRLLLVIDEMEVGGTQRQMVNLVRGLDRERFEVELVYFRFSSFLVDELESMGVVVHQVPKAGRIDPGFVWALRHLMLRGRYDIVHAFSFTSELWSALVLSTMAAASRALLVSSVRGTYEWYSALQWKLKRWVTARSATVIANSQQAAFYAAQQMGLPPNRIQVVYNGLPARGDMAAEAGADNSELARAEARVAMRRQLGVEPDTMLLLFVGRLVDHKNLPTLLTAMASLRRLADEQARPVQLLLAGDGPDRHSLEQQTESLGLSTQVQWLGERRDVPALMDASDAVVLPSWREGLSNVILEGMQAGKPVIASRAGGNVESVVPGETGLLFEPADSEALAVEILRLASDAELGQRLGRAGAERVAQTFALPTMVAKTQACYEAALSATGARARVARHSQEAGQ